MQISILIPQDLWRYSKKTMKLAANIHHFTTAAKQCAFDNNRVAIYIFVKGLGDAPIFTSKIHEKDTQTLAEVIRLVRKLSAAQKRTATLTPTVSMMSGDDKCFVCG